MIETIMIFAAGFLTAALLALLVIPAINRRAERLSRRRVEAMFPMSLTELTAEKDHLRAEFAVAQRRLERKAEDALAVKQASMEELGRRAVRIEALGSDLAARNATIAQLEADLGETRARLATTEEGLAATQASLASTREILKTLNDTQAATLEELAATRSALDDATRSLADTRTELGSARDMLRMREAEIADLNARHAAALSEIDARRIAISDLGNRLGTQTARAEEAERSLAERRAEVADERRRLAEVYKSLNSEQDRGLTLEGRVRSLTADRDGKAAEAATLRTSLEELREAHEAVLVILDQRREASTAQQSSPDSAAANERIAALSAVNASLEAALAVAHEERTRLEQELRTENVDLRRRIEDLAGEIIRTAEAEATLPAGPVLGAATAPTSRAGRQTSVV